MSATIQRGATFQCPVCGAEISVLRWAGGGLRPRCCATAMQLLGRRLSFYYCRVCGAEVAVVRRTTGCFRPRCCNTDMRAEAA